MNSKSRKSNFQILIAKIKLLQISSAEDKAFKNRLTQYSQSQKIKESILTVLKVKDVLQKAHKTKGIQIKPRTINCNKDKKALNKSWKLDFQFKV